MKQALEFHETPAAFTRYLFAEIPIVGTCVAPCVGAGAILTTARELPGAAQRTWVTNDLDPHWPADSHADASTQDWWNRLAAVDWVVENPPFSAAEPILQYALDTARAGVALHVRMSFNEPLRKGRRQWLLVQHPPSGILFLPRFAYQRSKTTGKWTTDNVGACWLVWLKRPVAGQFIRYAPPTVARALEAETGDFRRRMDRLMGYQGTEIERQAQRRAA